MVCHMNRAGQVPRRLTAEARRAHILQAARTVIVAQGLAGVSVRDIAREAGISSGTVSHHFASVDDILAAVLRAESDRFQATKVQALAKRRSPLDGLLRLGDALLADRRDVREYWSIWLEHWARAPHDPALAAWQSRRYRTWREVVAGLVDEGVTSGELGAVVPADVATELVALIDGLALQAFFSRSDLTPRAARMRFRVAVRERVCPADARPDDRRH